MATGRSLDADLVLARRVAETAVTVPGIHAVDSGRLSEAATYGMNEKVVGVVVKDASVEVHVIASSPLTRPLHALANSLRRHLLMTTRERAVDVVIEDLAQEEPTVPASAAQTSVESSEGTQERSET